MRIAGYLAVWVVLMAATALEVMLFGMPLTLAVLLIGIMGLAVLKAVLIALFYQHVWTEERWVKLFYLLALVTAVGLIVGMITSLRA